MDVQLPQVILVIPTYLLITAKKKKNPTQKALIKILKAFPECGVLLQCFCAQWAIEIAHT